MTTDKKLDIKELSKKMREYAYEQTLKELKFMKQHMTQEEIIELIKYYNDDDKDELTVPPKRTVHDEYGNFYIKEAGW